MKGHRFYVRPSIGVSADRLTDYSVEPGYYLDGLLRDTQYYVIVQAVDDSGNISQASESSHETTADDNTPDQPADLTATQLADALDTGIRRHWHTV